SHLGSNCRLLRGAMTSLKNHQREELPMALSADVRFAIQDLYARYSHAVDANDGEAWIKCWAREGEFVPAVGPTAGTPYRGHEAISQFGYSRPDNYNAARIWTGSYLIEELNGYVKGTCY